MALSSGSIYCAGPRPGKRCIFITDSRTAALGRSALRERSLNLSTLRCSATTYGRFGGESQNDRPVLDQNEYDFFNDPVADSTVQKKKKAEEKMGDKPYRYVPGIGKFYLDELDVITLLDPPRLSPLDPVRYSHAAFIWKKIGDVPEERRIRLLNLLNPSLVQSMWQVCGQRYDSPKLFSGDGFSLLPAPEIEESFSTTMWKGKIHGDTWPWSWLEDITMEFFVGEDAAIYGRLNCNGLFGSAISRNSPLYFKVKPAEFVSVTNDECDLALDFSHGQLHLKNTLPPSFRQPEKPSWPLQEFVAYVRPVGPGVMVAQLWQSRLDPRQAPPRNLGKLVIVKQK